MTDVVGKLWGFCHTLRHEGVDYGDYIEQITYLLFLKMADERGVDLPKQTDWAFLRKQSGTQLLDAYVEALRLLGKEPGILGDIFSGALSRFTNPVNLKKLISLIDETEWVARRRCEGGGLRGTAREGSERREEGCWAVLHAPRTDRVDRPMRQARPKGEDGLQDW